jgi:hypothetical protein
LCWHKVLVVILDFSALISVGIRNFQWIKIFANTVHEERLLFCVMSTGEGLFNGCIQCNISTIKATVQRPDLFVENKICFARLDLARSACII